MTRILLLTLATACMALATLGSLQEPETRKPVVLAKPQPNLCDAPEWKPGMKWSVKYMVPQENGEGTGWRLVPKLCKYTVLDDSKCKQFADTPVHLVRLQREGERTSILLTYRTADHVLLLVERDSGDRIKVVDRNKWGPDSAMFINLYPQIGIYDSPRFPLEPGVRNVVDRRAVEGAVFEVMPLDRASMTIAKGVLTAIATTKSGKKIEVEGPGTPLNPYGFYQETTLNDAKDQATVRMILLADEIYEKRWETTLTYDGAVWWKQAETKQDGKTLFMGERVDDK